MIRIIALTAFCFLAASLCTPSLHGQRSVDATAVQANIRFSATRANAPPGTCGCFFLTGGAADAAILLLPRLSAVVEAGGNTVDRVAGTTRGLSTITLLAGPRYSLPTRHATFAVQTLFGAARGFNADFVVGPRRSDTATSFAMVLGGFAEIGLTRSIALRAVQVDYVQTDLPNGQDDRQRNVRLGAGVTFRIALPSSR